MNKPKTNQKTSKRRPPDRSRLGKEAKIGVSVILVLLLILGLVVTWRLTHSTTDEKLASADNLENRQEKIGKEHKGEAAGKHHKDETPSAPTAGRSI